MPPRAEMAGEAWEELLGPLRAEPARAAILTDIDGTLAPIVERADEAAVPAAAREALRELNRRYGLVGCVSGRQALEARELVGLDELAYAGNHGLEILLPGAEAPLPDPSLDGREHDAAAFVAAGPLDLDTAELRLEDKGPIQALHWRGAGDETRAEARARELAVAAGHAGLEPRWGRKVLELRPAGGGGKDAAVASLLAAEGLDRAVYAGDDRTDLDAFGRLRELREGGDLAFAVCVGVLSPEAPSGLSEESDVEVAGPEGWLALLQWLARPEG